jgi:hypothetical protein
MQTVSGPIVAIDRQEARRRFFLINVLNKQGPDELIIPAENAITISERADPKTGPLDPKELVKKTPPHPLLPFHPPPIFHPQLELQQSQSSIDQLAE